MQFFHVVCCGFSTGHSLGLCSQADIPFCYIEWCSDWHVSMELSVLPWTMLTNCICWDVHNTGEVAHTMWGHIWACLEHSDMLFPVPHSQAAMPVADWQHLWSWLPPKGKRQGSGICLPTKALQTGLGSWLLHLVGVDLWLVRMQAHWSKGLWYSNKLVKRQASDYWMGSERSRCPSC